MGEWGWGGWSNQNEIVLLRLKAVKLFTARWLWHVTADEIFLISLEDYRFLSQHFSDD